jgi:acyl carrier protein
VNFDIDQELYERVVQFVAKSRAYKKEKIKPQSSMYHDLGCDGIDGQDLLADFRDEFDVDITNFAFDRHFGPELPLNPFVWIYWKICEPEKLTLRGQYKKVPITVMDLYEAAKSKKFPDLSERPVE